MRVITEADITRLVDDIVKEVQPEAVYLFGSRARGDAREDSDYDLLVIEHEPFGKERSRYRELAKLWHLVLKHRLPVDVILYSEKEIEHWRQEPGHVVERALREGRALYAA
jgi:predicted nucleotidyltransferase